MWRTREFKYVYSAADDREWLFPCVPGRLEERSVAGNPAFTRTLEAHRRALIAALRADGYTTPLDGDGWKRFDPPPPVPIDPDAWQLFQDQRSVADRFPSGYAPRIDTLQPPPMRGF